jgi:hypothetical protein
VKENFLKEFEMKLFKVEIPKSKLSSIPEDERVFFVLFGALLNDLSMFQKLMIFSTNPKTTNQVERTAQISQTLCLARFQIGILSEGWQLLQQKFFGTGLSKKYEPLLSEPIKENFDKLKDFFSGKDNWMTSVRNNFCFHYPSSEEIKKLIDEAPASEIFEIYMSEYFGNCLFSMSNTLINFGILKAMEKPDTQTAMDRWLQDAMKVARWFGDFLGECLLIIANKHLGLKSYEVEIPEPPDINEVTLPYFIKGN